MLDLLARAVVDSRGPGLTFRILARSNDGGELNPADAVDREASSAAR